MIMIVDDYILLLTSLAAILWGFVRYMLAFRASETGADKASLLSLRWVVQSVVVFVTAAAVMIVVARFGTENVISDVVSLSAAALYAGMALLLPRAGYKLNISRLDRAILLILAVLLLTGGLYDNLAR